MSDGTNTGYVSTPMGLLAGDTNFREDVNVDGFIDAVDASLVKSKSGTALPSQ